VDRAPGNDHSSGPAAARHLRLRHPRRRLLHHAAQVQARPSTGSREEERSPRTHLRYISRPEARGRAATTAPEIIILPRQAGLEETEHCRPSSEVEQIERKTVVGKTIHRQEPQCFQTGSGRLQVEVRCGYWVGVDADVSNGEGIVSHRGINRE